MPTNLNLVLLDDFEFFSFSSSFSGTSEFSAISALETKHGHVSER